MVETECQGKARGRMHAPHPPSRMGTQRRKKSEN